jgi:peroxiredoxin
MKFARITGVMIILLILGFGLAGCKPKPAEEDQANLVPDVPMSQAAQTPDSITGQVEVGESAQPESDAESSSEPEHDPGKNRKQAPGFTLADLSGRLHSLADFQGKVVLVDFWATWCGPCLKEIPHLVKLYDTYKSKGFVILGVGLDRQSNIAKFAADNKISYTVLVDEKSVAARPYGVSGIPRTLIIDKKGRIAFDHTGFAPGMEKEMEAEIKTLLAEEY